MKDYKYYTFLGIFLIIMGSLGWYLVDVTKGYILCDTAYAAKEKIILKCPNCNKSIVCSGCGHILFLVEE